MAARFPTTRWSRLGRVGDPADPASRAALEQLCRDYWFPLYAFIRARGHESHEAEDLVQGFLADLLERGDLATTRSIEGPIPFVPEGGLRSLPRQSPRPQARREARRRASRSSRSTASMPSPDMPASRRTSGRPSACSNANGRWHFWAGCSNGSKRSAVAEGKKDLFDQIRPALQGDRPGPGYRVIAETLT